LSVARRLDDRLFLVLLSLTLLNSAGLIAIGVVVVSDRLEAARERQEAEIRLEDARQRAERVRSATIARSLAQALIILKDEIGRFPNDGEDWAAMLIERQMIDPAMLAGPEGSGIERAYHYVPPGGSGDGPIVHEDPELWPDGGHVVYADTRTEWLDREAFEGVLASFGGGG